MANFTIEDVLGGGGVHGTLKSYMVLDDFRVKKAPKNLSAEEASAFGTAGNTAHNALFMGSVKCGPGITVLTQGTGGVSCFAIQLGSTAGVIVIATSSLDEKLEVARKLGAQHQINYKKTPNSSEEVLRITNGRGVNHVVDVAGSTTIEESLRSCRKDGTVSVLGMLSESKTTDLISMIMLGGKSIRDLGGSGSGVMLKQLVKFIEQHDIHPIIANVFEFDQAVDVFVELKKRRDVGKTVIKV